MDAQQALADLTEISSQIQAAVVFDESGTLAAATVSDPAQAEALARGAVELLGEAERIKVTGGALSQLEVATLEGSVFIVRDEKTRIAATTGPEPTVGLVFYDLKSALRQLSAQPERKPRAAAKKTTTPRKKATTTPKRKSTTQRKKTDAS